MVDTVLNNPFDLGGRSVVVTGGARGIGLGIAEVLAGAGARVIIADRDSDAATDAAAALSAAGGRAETVAVDLAEEASIVAACQEIVSRFGAPWALVNNAGVQDRELLLEGSSQEWDRMYAINTRAPFLMTRELARAMVSKDDGGRIVNIASTALIGQLVEGHAPYAASKAALLGLGLSGALELAPHRITVNTLLPGGVDTPGSRAAKGPPVAGPARRMPPLGLCEGNDIGVAVCFLVSPGARRVTNQTFAVDGGWSIT